MRNKIILMFAIFLIVTLSFASAQQPVITSEPVYKRATDITIRLPCTSNGVYCSTNATCRTTILTPKGEILINNQEMIRNDAVFEINLSANQTDLNGEYQFNVVCSDNNNSISRFLKFHITPNGELATTSKGILYLGFVVILFIFFVLLIFSGIKAEHIALKTFLFLFAYLTLIGITFISWNLSLDYLTSSPFMISFFRIVFYFLTIALFPVLLLSTFYTVYMMTKIKALQNMLDKGMPVDEAYERQVKGGLKGFKKW